MSTTTKEQGRPGQRFTTRLAIVGAATVVMSLAGLVGSATAGATQHCYQPIGGGPETCVTDDVEFIPLAPVPPPGPPVWA